MLFRSVVSEWVTNLRPVATKFTPSINVTIMFNPAKVARAVEASGNGVREAIHVWDDLNRNWMEMESTHVVEEGVATCQTEQLGAYTVLAVSLKPIILEAPEPESPLQVMTVVPAVIGGTCLILLCAVVSFAVHRRSRGKKEVEKLKSAMERRDDNQPTIDPSVLQLAQQLAAKDKEDEKVSDEFQPADDVSALELSEQMARRQGEDRKSVV